MPTVSANESMTFNVPIGQKITVTATAGETGSLIRLADTVGGEPYSPIAISGAAVNRGPYTINSRWDVVCTAGSLDVVIGLPGVASAPTSSTDGAVAVWSGTDGNELADSGEVPTTVGYDLLTAASVDAQKTLLAIDGGDVSIASITGATYGTVQKNLDVFHSAGVISGGVLTDLGDGTITVGVGTGFIRATDSDVAELLSFDWAQETPISLTDTNINYVYVEYNAGTPQVAVATSERTDFNTNVLLGSVYRDGTTLHINNERNTAIGNHASRMIQRMMATMPFQHASGAAVAEAGTSQLTVTAGVFWEGLTEVTTAAIDTTAAGTFTAYYRDGGSGFTAQTAQTAIDILYYDDNSGTLAALGSNKFATRWLYLETDGLSVVYGREEHTTQANAEEETAPATIPGHLLNHGKLIARIIIKKSQTTFVDIESAFEDTLSKGNVTDHGNLAGLGDDDHTQYALAGVATASRVTMAATDKLLGRSTAGAGDIEEIDCTAAGRSMIAAANVAAQTALLDAMVGDAGSGGTKGLVPAPGVGDAAKYLTGAGTYTTPSGGMTDIVSDTTPQLGGDLDCNSSAVNFSIASDMASATTVDLGAATPNNGNIINITGATTPINSFGTTAPTGAIRYLKFAAKNVVITHNATSMISPYGASITTGVDDVAMVLHEGSGNWRILDYWRANGIGPRINIGPVAGHENTGNQGVFIGTGTTGGGTAHGVNNIAIGHLCASALTSQYNILLGYNTLGSGPSANYNILIGDSAGASGSLTGAGNVLLGSRAGDTLTSGASNVLIGGDGASTYKVQAPSATGSFQVNIGNAFLSNSSNNTGVTSTKQAGIGAIASGYQFNIDTGGDKIGLRVDRTTTTDTDLIAEFYNSNGLAGSVDRTTGFISVSDGTLKENFAPATPKLADIRKIKVQNFTFKGDKSGKKILGVVTQQVKEVFPRLIRDHESLTRYLDPDWVPAVAETEADRPINADETWTPRPAQTEADRPKLDKKETVQALSYQAFIPMLIKCVQELADKNDVLEQRLAVLEGV